MLVNFGNFVQRKKNNVTGIHPESIRDLQLESRIYTYLLVK